MKRRLFATALSVVLLLTTIPVQQVTAVTPPWGAIKNIVIADAVGAIDGYLSSGTGWGALFGGVKGSLSATEPGTGGAKWKAPELLSFSIGYHHNMALHEVLNALAGSDIHTERANQLIIDYMDRESTIISGGKKGYDHYLTSMDHSFEDIMRRIQEAVKNGTISDQFYANLQAALEILGKDTDDPQSLITEATETLYRDILSDHGNSISAQNTLLLDFDKIEIVYEPKQRVSDSLDIIVVVPVRARISPAVAAMDIIAATIFEDVLRHSYAYWASRKPPEVSVKDQIILILTLKSRIVLSSGVPKEVDVEPIVSLAIKKCIDWQLTCA